MNDFFAQLYELFGSYYIEGFSDNLYHGGIYVSTGISLISVVTLGTVFFYVLKVQKPHTFGLTVWFLNSILLSIINFVIAYSLSYSSLEGIYAEQNQDLPYGFGSFVGFSMMNFFWSLVLCLLVSVFIQFLRINLHGDVPFKIQKSHK